MALEKVGPINRSRLFQICLEFADDSGLEYQMLAKSRVFKERIIKDFFAEHPEIVFQNSSYSQNGEDLILSRLLEDHPAGKYIDVGAHHPFRFSNTAKLYSEGWSGLNVDSNPESIKDFETYRKFDDNMCIALGKTEEIRSYFQYEESALNTFAHDRALQLQDLGIHPISVDPIKVVKAKSFLESRFTNDTYLFTLDVEGLDLEIIRDLDYQCFKPCFIIFEFEMQSLHDVFDLISDVDFLNYYKAKSVAFNSVILQSVNCDHAN
jgi:hypothetical protein